MPKTKQNGNTWLAKICWQNNSWGMGGGHIGQSSPKDKTIESAQKPQKFARLK